MENKTFTFHIHVPKGVEKVGQPVVLSDIKELGWSWKNPIVKLHRPFLENPTYWKSQPVKIPLSKSLKKVVIKYKFAICTSEYVPRRVSERIVGFNIVTKTVFEGNDEDSRILD